jgi:predicted SprT family Zn-dependent metalloprotease
MSLQCVSEFLDLDQIFDELNQKFFDGFLDWIPITWNSRLRSSAGRFIPGSRKWYLDYPPKIEIASYLKTEPNAAALVRDTLGHELIHYWLWVRRRPYGHTEEFYVKMRQMGVSRYNPVPRTRPYKWLYRCGNCQQTFPARRRLARALACAKCCRAYADGKYDARFKLELDGAYRAEPAPEPAPVNDLS